MEENNKITENNSEDDGSLAFLKIPRNPDNLQFHCEAVKQSKLINKSFWVRDIIENIETKHGSGRTLVMISEEKDTPESGCQKFFTNSKEVKYILERVKELDAFPRFVTLRCEGNNFYLE